MNIKTAIARCDRLYPNSVEYEDKVTFLALLDGRIYNEILKNRTGAPADFAGYTLTTPGGTELLAPFPHDDVYVKYLSMEIDLLNGNIERYNNKAVIFNSAYSDLANYIVRTRKQTKNISFNSGGETI